MMASKRPAVAYCWVSTRAQGKSGLGLEAQAAAIDRFADAEGYRLAERFVEVETGKGADALSGHAAAAPPSSVMKWRRLLTRSPHRRAAGKSKVRRGQAPGHPPPARKSAIADRSRLRRYRQRHHAPSPAFCPFAIRV